MFTNILYHIKSSSNVVLKQKKIDISLGNWKNINEQSNFLDLSNLVQPSPKLANEIKDLIKPGTPITEEDYFLISNCITIQVKDFKSIILNFQKYIQWNNGSQSGNIFSFQSIEILQKLYYAYYTEYDFKVLFTSPELYSVCYYTNSENENIIKIISTLCSLHFKEKIFTIENEVGQTNYYASLYFQNIKNYWLVSDIGNANFTYIEYKENNLLKNIWSLTNDKNNLLTFDIINLMIENKDEKEFEVENAFEILDNLNNNCQDDFDMPEIISLFYKNSKIEEEILEMDDLQLKINNYLIYKIIQLSNSEKLLKKVQSALDEIDEKDLQNSLQENDYLFDILLLIKKKYNDFSLGLSLNNVLYEFVKDTLIKGNTIFTLDDWQKENWSNIIRLLDERNFKNFSDRITKLALDEKENLSEVFFELNNEFINKNFLFTLLNKDISSFRLYIQIALQNPIDIEKLKFIENILKLENKKEIKFGRDLKEIIKDSILTILNDNDNDIVKRISNVIANRFSIKN
ncbi:hypothetical protein [Flavobacterium sp. 245]|uniref:hypothetical protein n=1 Tax=Flavobacterium sp. 245 TaxID=2512115 RepID=UPI00105BD748|nr:hypothetical protein [Flavobacterium sp. 245]TDO94959.1 hypothetical protein EV145_11546 [Flavobacterium sp. 245]